ncbi:MAG: ankyrin repeat domain-containing protein [Desulfobacterales bacterium]|nr:MAG: ankyrin repeat domain-containing protein [Desulfobacterales bacterium]
MKTFTLIILVTLLGAGLWSVEKAESNDDTVYEAQKKLNELGYDAGKPDGIWGKKTVEAVKSFQRDDGLPETGQLDALTIYRLNAQEPPAPMSLSEAVGLNDVSEIEALLDAGADVNTTDELGETPLHIAAVRGYSQAASLLIAEGADINAGDVRGLTPVHAAAWGGNNEIVTMLVDKGADISARDEEGVTPLHAAALAGRNETVALLIARGANVNVKNDEGMTPLHAAALAGDRETVVLLIARGANVNARNKDGLTPLHTASQKGDQDIVQLLRQHMNQKRKDN